MRGTINSIAAAALLLHLSPPPRSRPASLLLTDLNETLSAAVNEALAVGEQRTAAALQERLGLSDEETVRLLVRHPEVLGYSFESNVAPTIDALQRELGMSNGELSELLLGAPSMLGLSVEGTLLPRIASLRSLLALRTDELRQMLRKFPRLLTYQVEERLETLRTLLAFDREPDGGQAELSSLVRRYPQVLSLSADGNIAPTLAALQELLCCDEDDELCTVEEVEADVREIVLRLPSILGLSVERNLTPKLCYLASELGLSRGELRDSLLREPAVLGASLDKALRPNIECWRHELGEGIDQDLGAVVLARGMRFLTCSHNNRVRPRLQSAREAGVPAFALLTKMRLTDAEFASWLNGASMRVAALEEEDESEGLEGSDG